MKLHAYIGFLLLTCLLPFGAWAADSGSANTQNQGLGDEISQYLSGQSIQLGGSYTQSYFFLTNHTNSHGTLTDNGRASPIIDYTSSEHILYKFPMKNGDGVWGFNFTGSFGQPRLRYQTYPGQSVLRGIDVGTHIDGDYLGVAPFVYLRLGPIYPGTDSYWLFGYGLGGALFHFSGLPEFDTTVNGKTTITAMPVSSSTKLFLYQTWRWQFHFGNWDVVGGFKELDSERKVIGNYYAGYAEMLLGIDYSIRF